MKIIRKIALLTLLIISISTISTKVYAIDENNTINESNVVAEENVTTNEDTATSEITENDETEKTENEVLQEEKTTNEIYNITIQEENKKPAIIAICVGVFICVILVILIMKEHR